MTNPRAATLQARLAACKPPYIEVAGPTPEGYAFLRELGLRLPAPIAITNIENPVVLNPFGDAPSTHQVDAIVDVRRMPYSDASIGMLLVSSLPLYVDHDSHHKDAAIAEYRTAKLAVLDPGKAHNLHLALLLEAKRTLRRGGLLIVENVWPQDSPAAAAIGLRALLSPEEEAQFQSQIYCAQ